MASLAQQDARTGPRRFPDRLPPSSLAAADVGLSTEDDWDVLQANGVQYEALRRDRVLTSRLNPGADALLYSRAGEGSAALSRSPLVPRHAGRPAFSIDIPSPLRARSTATSAAAVAPAAQAQARPTASTDTETEGEEEVRQRMDGAFAPTYVDSSSAADDDAAMMMPAPPPRRPATVRSPGSWLYNPLVALRNSVKRNFSSPRWSTAKGSYDDDNHDMADNGRSPAPDPRPQKSRSFNLFDAAHDYFSSASPEQQQQQQQQHTQATASAAEDMAPEATPTRRIGQFRFASETPDHFLDPLSVQRPRAFDVRARAAAAAAAAYDSRESKDVDSTPVRQLRNRKARATQQQQQQQQRPRRTEMPAQRDEPRTHEQQAHQMRRSTDNVYKHGQGQAVHQRLLSAIAGAIGAVWASVVYALQLCLRPLFGVVQGVKRITSATVGGCAALVDRAVFGMRRIWASVGRVVVLVALAAGAATAVYTHWPALQQTLAPLPVVLMPNATLPLESVASPSAVPSPGDSHRSAIATAAPSGSADVWHAIASLAKQVEQVQQEMRGDRQQQQDRYDPEPVLRDLRDAVLALAEVQLGRDKALGDVRDSVRGLQARVDTLAEQRDRPVDEQQTASSEVVEVLQREQQQARDAMLAQVTRMLEEQEQRSRDAVQEAVRAAYADQIEARIEQAVADAVRKQHADVTSQLQELANKQSHKQPAAETTVVDESSVQRVVQQQLAAFAADKLGKPDFALLSGGAQVVHALTSASYELESPNRVLRMLGIGRRTTRPPEVALMSDTSLGKCWAFPAGDTGHLTVRLSHAMVPTEISIEHVDPRLAYDLTTAPRDIEVYAVYGYPPGSRATASTTPSSSSSTTATARETEVAGQTQRMPRWQDIPVASSSAQIDISKPHKVLIASFAYRPPGLDRVGEEQTVSPIQTFPVRTDVAADVLARRPVRMLTVVVNSNWGNADFTCLYRVRVHGRQQQVNTQ